MTAYRFCRSDDIGLLVEAYERCRGPEDEGEPELDREGFKRLIRDLDLWCSSCMVASEGREPVGVLFGAKRPESTLVHTLRVHPGHRRQGHGRHLLTSLSQKLAILGPPNLVAEVPSEREAAAATFAACGWRREGSLTDWRRPPASAGQAAGGEFGMSEALAEVGYEDLAEAGLLAETAGCWQRDPQALARRREVLSGLAFHSPDRIEAWVLWEEVPVGAWPIQVLGCAPSDLGRLGLAVVLEELARQAGDSALLLPRAAPGELDAGLLGKLGFEPGAGHVLFTGTAQAA